MSNLMEKLAISKAIMDKHNSIGRGQVQGNINTPSIQEFNTPQANYNIPQEIVTESKSSPVSETPTKDRILSSKLPDEIKRLMIENPIEKPSSNNTSVLSDELVEKASKLMGTKKQEPIQPSNNSGDLRQMMKEVVKEVLMENGILLESNSKANETILIKVGKHIFEGQISRIKKVK